MVSRKAFVHIGYPKTGTTALQAFLHHHSTDLLKHGVLYPETGKLWHAQHELAGLFQSDDKRLYWVKTNLEKPYLELLKEEIEGSKASTLILSSEAFTFTDKHLDLKGFLDKCGFQDIKIICFLRRQDLWVESAFTQVYKAGLYNFDFNSFSNSGWSMNYMGSLKAWEHVFGKENMSIQILDREMGHNDVVPVMASILGVEELTANRSNGTYNTSLAPDALHYSHLIHKENNEELLGWLVEILEEYSTQQNGMKFVFMSDPERENFLRKFAPINRQFARKYLGREKAFADFKGFGGTVNLYPKINEVDFGPVCHYVMNEIQKKVACGQEREWLEREEFLKTQNARIEELVKGTKSNKKVNVSINDPDAQPATHLTWNDNVHPKVAIITRTRNRPIMLPRVLISIGKQTCKDFIWVLVNDAGDRTPIEAIAKQALENGIDVKVIHRAKSLGMEAAANDGVCQSQSTYIVIHDDDDTWETEFLERTVGFLDENLDVPGVITWSNRIDEILMNDCIHFKGVSPYNHWLKNIYLSDLAVENRFPPISFLFRRSVYDGIGGFDEGLPVLGDWDFHLKVLMEGDIHVLPYALANYHFRENLEKGNIYGNTVTSGMDKHVLYDAVYRNKKLREDIKNGVSGIGTLLALGQMLRRTNHMSDAFVRLSHASKSSRFFSFIRKVLKV